MLKFDSNNVLSALTYISSALSEWRTISQIMGKGLIGDQHISFGYRVNFLKSVEILEESAETLGMFTSLSAIQSAKEDLINGLASNRPVGTHELQHLSTIGDRIVHTFLYEMRSRVVVAMPPGHVQYFAPEAPLFGDIVDDAFPSSAQEIADAGRCRAVGQWTACVMHLMRALETPITKLAEHTGVKPEQNWNTALNQIDAKLREVQKSRDGAEAEQWASEAVLQLRAIKNAWRNHAMHGRARYDEAEAVTIYEAVKTFMQRLASRLTE